MTDLHSALKTTVLAEHVATGIHYKLIRLQNGKDDFVDTLHARPNTWTSGGVQSSDFLSVIGFKRSPCAFHQGECFCRKVTLDLNLHEFHEAFSKAYQAYEKAYLHLGHCGIALPQPEGIGFFHGRHPSGRASSHSECYGDGHKAPQSNQLKSSEDDYFHYVLTWIAGGQDKGWTTHYRPKHIPLSGEIQSVLKFLGGFRQFANCPEYDFEECYWRFATFKGGDHDPFDRNVESVHRQFDDHSTHFAPGIEHLLHAHALMLPWNASFLSPAPPKSATKAESPKAMPSSPNTPHALVYDVAFSFAGSARPLVEKIATILKGKGYRVFYDDFYPEQLWGKDLVALFDRIYRKESRFCMMFLSKDYAEKMWTTHERKSATARAVQERGNEYILPVKVEDVDIDGLAPTIGYLSAADFSAEQIAELLIKKLEG